MNLSINRKKTHKIIAFIIACIPFLAYLSGPFVSGNISIAHLIVYALLLVLPFFSGFKISGKNAYIYIYCIYIFIGWLLSILLLDSSNNRNSGLGVLIYNILILFIFVGLRNRTVVRYHDIVKCIVFISLFSCCLLVLQYIKHYSIGGYIQLFPLDWYIDDLRTSWGSIGRITNGIASGEFRPAAIFNEPSQFAQYVSISLAVTLYYYKCTKKTKFLYVAFFITVCLLLSTSSFSFLISVVIWTVFFIDNMILTRRINAGILLLIIIFIFVALFIRNKNFMTIIIYRLFVGGSSVSGRAAGYTYYGQLSFFEQLFGIGVGHEPRSQLYFTAGSAELCRVGILGSIIYLCCVVKSAIRGSTLKIWIAITYIVIFICAGVDEVTSMFFYATLLYADDDLVVEEDARSSIVLSIVLNI